MSNSPVIPKEKLSAYQRWELHPFDAPADARPPAPNTAAAEAEKVRHIHQHAYDAGHAAGLREGAEKAVAEAQQIKAVLAAVERQSHEINQRLAQDVLELALEVARQMVRQALEVKPELIVTLIHDALARTTQPPAGATIALNPADAALVRGQLGDELAAAGWRIAEDPKLARGGALLQTAATRIDATMATRWQRVAAALGHSTDWIAK
ncbi:MAG: flagellar assembly protein FliH [Betaproteobacteria bacterium]|nr:flagellar assembly protein FliH [Betaproteobacteria bacterium]